MICKCGHRQEDHDINRKTKNTTGMCCVAAQPPCGKYADECMSFIPDNLKFLELMSDKRCLL